MRANGNGNPMLCVQNLVSMVRGENPYERLKGIDPSLIDRPYNEARPLLVKDVQWLIRTYEPRVDLNDINLEDLLSQEGAFYLRIKAAVKGG